MHHLPTIALAVTLIVSSTDMPISPPLSYTDTLWLARAVQGEVSVMGPEREKTGAWIVHVARNRVVSKWFPDSIEQVIRQGFAGALVVDSPEPWAWEVVGESMRTEDSTNGSLFVFGGLDITECMDWSSHQESAYRSGWLFSVHIFKRWPYINECTPTGGKK